MVEDAQSTHSREETANSLTCKPGFGGLPIDNTRHMRFRYMRDEAVLRSEVSLREDSIASHMPSYIVLAKGITVSLSAVEC